MDKLPADFENRYHSDKLRQLIADDGMWYVIPAVSEKMNSRSGIRRLEENHPLFSFIDTYLSDFPYAFEPNMKDGRFVLLSANVSHQGLGVSVSRELPGYLEVGHFWYPAEFTNRKVDVDQVYVPAFSARIGQELADMIRNHFEAGSGYICTFPFTMDLVVTLKENFLDRLPQTENIIRRALKNSDDLIKKNGEGLIQYMRKIMENA